MVLSNNSQAVGLQGIAVRYLTAVKLFIAIGFAKKLIRVKDTSIASSKAAIIRIGNFFMSFRMK